MVIYSLFDGSGIMAHPWAVAGHSVYCFNADEGNHGAYSMRVEHPNIHYINQWIDYKFDPAGMVFKDQSGKQLVIPCPDIIFSFPDCTMMANCGSKHDRTAESVALAVDNARVAERLGKKYRCPWMVENPVGKLCTEWRKPDAYFHPFMYGGHMVDEDEPFHPRMPKFDGYTKKTCLWFGNGFVMPPELNGPINIGFFWAWKYCGGNSTKTKQLRSLTPRGFARAVFIANSTNC